MRVVDVLVLVCLCGARACRGPAVRISGVAGDTWSSYLYLDNTVRAEYGDNVNIFCTGDNVKKLRVDGQGTYPEEMFELGSDERENGDRKYDIAPPPPASSGQLIEVNKTTLQLSLEKPGIGWYVYTCTHVETACAAQLQVRVVPILTVVYPNVHHKPSFLSDYFVPIDEDFELVCYGNEELEITGGKFLETITTISVNETTVKSNKLRVIEYSTRVYNCRHRASRVTTGHVLNFDYVPAAIELWCTERNWQISCSWKVLSRDTVFTLFYTDKNGNSVRLFYENFSVNQNKKTRSCEWSLRDMQLVHGLAISGNINLVVEACRNIYLDCSNQAHIIDCKSIIKTWSPKDLELSRATSHSAVVTWRGPWTDYYDDVPVEYKLIYRLPGLKDLNGSSSQYTCDHQALRYLEKCEGELNLSCPGAFYEVEVYAKFTSTPRDDAYWSEPARVTLRTDPATSSDTLDPACLKEPELIDNKYVAAYEIKKLKRSTTKEGSALQLKVKSMERKLEKITELCRESSLDDCEDFVLRQFKTPTKMSD